MDKRARVRLGALLALAAITAAASFYPPVDRSLAATAPRREQKSPASPNSRNIGTTEVDNAAPMEEQEEVDPFTPRGWQAPPAPVEQPKPAAAAAAPAAPVAPTGPPPLPFKFMGRMNDGADNGQQMIYLSKGEQIVVVQGGETLDGTYKVVSIEADHIDFEHLPTGEKQTLALPAPDK